MATPTKTLRIRPQLRAEIERIAKRSRRTFSDVAQELLEEAVRMRRCPGIYFATEASGREAKVQGTGLGVWEVIRDLTDLQGDEEKLRQWLPHVGPPQLKAVRLYYEQYRDEIDAEIEANDRALEEGLRSGFVKRV